MSWLSDDDPDEEFGDWDESDARVRPNPKGNRPRTKTRPEHGDSIIGRVLAVDRGRYTVLVDEDGPEERVLTTTRARELRDQAIVTGDRVDLVGDTSGDEGSLARIVRIRERTTLLRRSADDTDEVERIIVANADQLMIVVAAADPEPRPRLVDRYLVAAYDAGIAPLMVVTKTDLRDPTEFLANFAGLDIPVFRSAQDAHGVESRIVTDRDRAVAGSRGRHRQRRHRPRAAHFLVDRVAARADRRVDHRHPRRSLFRAGARQPRQHPPLVLGSARRLSGLPARLQPSPERARLRAERGGRRRPAAGRTGRLAAAAAAVAAGLSRSIA